MKKKITSGLMITLITVILLALSTSVLANPQGRGRGGRDGDVGRRDNRNHRGGYGLGDIIFGGGRSHGRGKRSYKKSRKFVNGHDARNGRWDGKGPRRW